MRTKKDFIEYGRLCGIASNYSPIIEIKGTWQKAAFEFGYNIGYNSVKY